MATGHAYLPPDTVLDDNGPTSANKAKLWRTWLMWTCAGKASCNSSRMTGPDFPR